MKLVLFTQGAGPPTAGILTERGVIELERRATDGQSEMEWLITNFTTLHPEPTSPATPLSEVQLLPPLPRPGKILCSTATFDGPSAAPLLLTLKSAESVIGPGGTVRLPGVGDPWQFVPEAELGLVIRGPAKNVSAADWRSVVFGYTCVIDVMAQGETQFGRDFWLAKSDTLGPLGPCIVTADEVADPAALEVRSSVNGEPAQSYAIAAADFPVATQVELATTIMTLRTGDVLACGTSRRGLRPLSDADEVRVEISHIGALNVKVAVR